MKPSLKLSLAALLLLVGGCQSSRHVIEMPTTAAPAPAPAPTPPTATSSPTTKKSQAEMTPEQALAELKAGNQRFVSGQTLRRNHLGEVKATASGQYPFAVVLSCLDSRQPVEIIFDQGIGDLFSARVAGNVLNDDILGSLEFACKASGAKLIAVVGHSNCGAVKGAIDGVELGSLTGLLAKIKPAMTNVPGDGQPHDSHNKKFVQAVAEENVRLVMQEIRERSPVLREMLDQGQIGLVGGMYDLSTGRVTFYSR